MVPIVFEGANTRLFQLASHLHHALRLGLLIPEFRARVGTPVRLAVGDPILRAELDAFGRDARSHMSFLRQRTYALSPHPLPSHRLGYEFEPRYRDAAIPRRDDAPRPAPEPVRGL